MRPCAVLGFGSGAKCCGADAGLKTIGNGRVREAVKRHCTHSRLITVP